MEYPTAETPRVGVTRTIPVQLGSGDTIHIARAIWGQPFPERPGRWSHSGSALCDRSTRHHPQVTDRPRSTPTCTACLAIVALSTVFVTATAEVE